MLNFIKQAIKTITGDDSVTHEPSSEGQKRYIRERLLKRLYYEFEALAWSKVIEYHRYIRDGTGLESPHTRGELDTASLYSLFPYFFEQPYIPYTTEKKGYVVEPRLKSFSEVISSNSIKLQLSDIQAQYDVSNEGAYEVSLQSGFASLTTNGVAYLDIYKLADDGTMHPQRITVVITTSEEEVIFAVSSPLASILQDSSIAFCVLVKPGAKDFEQPTQSRYRTFSSRES